MIYPIIIFIILVVIAAIYCANEQYDGLLLFGAFFFFSILATAPVTAAVWGVLYPFTSPVHHSHTYQLANLEDGPSTTAHYFLGTGSSNGTLQVSFYTQTDAYAQPHSITDDDTTIRIYQDLPASASPYLITTDTDPHFWTGSQFNGANTPTRYDFHVPPHTIKSDYSLDAK